MDDLGAWNDVEGTGSHGARVCSLKNPSFPTAMTPRPTRVVSSIDPAQPTVRRNGPSLHLATADTVDTLHITELREKIHAPLDTSSDNQPRQSR
jgi:hypothetical protein